MIVFFKKDNPTHPLRCRKMYKHLTVFLCRFMLVGMIFMPSVSMAADHCTNPTEYRVDRRCYVTDEQKKEKPYNATVYLIESGCTGTIIKRKNNLYVYTAKHCVADKDGNVATSITVMTQTGKELSVYLIRYGDYDTTDSDYDRSGDWAVYSITSAHEIASTNFTDKEGHWWDLMQLFTYDAQVIGYGVLKIMSDKEISNYKTKYLRYLKDEKGIIAKGDESQYGFDGKGGVYAYYGDYSGPYVVNFLDYLLDNDFEYYRDVFRNKKLKVSSCGFSAYGQSVGCQIWGGNSGGGVFDNEGNLMGILTGYRATIGGENHAAATSGIFEIQNVSFFK